MKLNGVIMLFIPFSITMRLVNIARSKCLFKQCGIRRIVVLGLFFSILTSCTQLPALAKKADFHDEDAKLILVNFHSKEALSVWQTSDDYTYASPNWQRPIFLQRSMTQVKRDYDLKTIDEWPIESLDLYCVVYAIESDTTVDDVLKRINQDSRVAFAEPLVEFELMKSDLEIGSHQTTKETNLNETLPKAPFLNDPLLNIQRPHNYLELENLHRLGTGKNIKVGIIDSGIDIHHPDLIGRIYSRNSFISESLNSSLEHGTAVAGIIGAAAGNKEGIVGLVPDAKLFSYEACGSLNENTFCDSFTLAKALEHAIQDKLHVLNLSLAGRETPLLKALIQKLISSGTVVIAAENSNEQRNFPAKMSDVIGVGSEVSEKLWFASEEQFSTQAGGGYRFFYGTSMSTAGITGFTAILASHHSSREVLSILNALYMEDCEQFLSQLHTDSHELLELSCRYSEDLTMIF